MKVTQALVAEAAGVSVATVSRALAGHEGIPMETRRKVEQVARRLGYGGVKRGGRKRKVSTLGVLVGVGGEGVMAEVLGGVTEAAGAAGMGVSVHVVRGAEADALRIRVAEWPVLAAGGLCGVIALGNWPTGLLAGVLGAVPLVTIGEDGEGQEQLRADRAGAVAEVYAWLATHGHREIGFVRGRTLTHGQGLLEGAFGVAARSAGRAAGGCIVAEDDVAALRRHTMTGVSAWICETTAIADRLRALLDDAKVHAPADVSFAVAEPLTPPGLYAGVQYCWRTIGALAVSRLQGRLEDADALPSIVSLFTGHVVGGAYAGPAIGVSKSRGK